MNRNFYFGDPQFNKKIKRPYLKDFFDRFHIRGLIKFMLCAGLTILAVYSTGGYL